MRSQFPTLLFTGGTRAGRSDLAQRWAESMAARRAFIATARAEDEETALRAARHKARRGEGWETLEAPLDILAALDRAVASGAGVVLLDCVIMWLSNLMACRRDPEHILGEADALARWLARAPLPAAVVTGEVGLGLAPMSSLGRAFCDVLGEANQMLAAACGHVLLVCCGLPLALKGQTPECLRCG